MHPIPVLALLALLALPSRSWSGVVYSGATDSTATGGNAVVMGGRTQTASGFRSAIVGGSGHVVGASYAIIGGGFQNTNDGVNVVISGGTSNTATAASNRSVIVGGRGGNMSGIDSLIGGGAFNTVAGTGSLVGAGTTNSVPGDNSSVLGGSNNTVDAQQSVIGGGYENEINTSIADSANGIFSGRGHYIDGSRCVISGGFNNEISRATAASTYSGILSGRDNVLAQGTSSTILGGEGNILGNAAEATSNSLAGGQFTRSFADNTVALGSYARLSSTANGSFYFGDSIDPSGERTAANTFYARFSGGYEFYSNTALTMGVQLPANATAWSAVSDRDRKEGFQEVDVVEVLDKVASMPMSTWQYIGDEGGTRYMGVMAQDLHEAFGLGHDDKTINTLVADGVAFAAIQGANAKIERLEEEGQAKDGRIAEQQEEIDALRARLERIEAMLAKP